MDADCSTAHDHAGFGGASALWLLVLVSLGVGYVLAVRRVRRRGRTWSALRTAAFLAGLLLVALGVAGPLAESGARDLRWHMGQHLLVGMVAPIGLVLGAPLTLILRASSPAIARPIARLLRTPLVHGLTHPALAVVSNVGGMMVLYATPLYAAMQRSALLHQLVHLHFVVAGCLFTWVIAGPDFAARRPTHRVRLGVLFASMALHGTFAKLMYARGWPAGTSHGLDELREAAQWMYYGGDLAECLLAAALLASWPTFGERSRKSSPHPPRERTAAQATP